MMNFLRKQMKWVMAIIVVAFLLSTFLMYEGRGTRRTPQRNSDGTMSDYEVAKINGRSLMRSELERRLRDYLSNYSSRNIESLDMGAIYQAVLDQAVLESQLAKEVEEKGIKVSDAEADRAMKEYADRYYPTRETFYQALANSGVKLDDYKKSLARQMATQRVISEAVGEVNVSEDKVLEFYDTMKALIYSRPEGFNVHMADFKTADGAEFLRAKLIAGEDWEEIISKDELVSHDMLNITKTPVFLPVSALTGTLSVLASIDVGTPTEVFNVGSDDYAVGLKTEHVDATVREYDEVSGDIRDLLNSQEQRSRLAAYEDSLRNKAQVVVNDTELFARAVVSDDTTVNVEEVIPELSQTAAETTETPTVEDTVTETTETPTVEETVTETTETPTVEDTVAETAETPTVEENVTETAAETPTVEETATETTETPTVEENVTETTETPTVEGTVTETTETPTVEETITETTETPIIEDTSTTEIPTVEIIGSKDTQE